jgi:hypothetical protein
MHGGKSPRSIAKAKERMEAQQAREAVKTFGLSRTVEPHQALLEEVYRTAGHVDWLQRVIHRHDEEDLVWGITRTVVNAEGGVDEVEYRAAPSIWLQLYKSERKHLAEVCRTAIACGIAERQVRIAEEQGRLIAQVIAGVLGDLGIEQDSPEVRKTVRRHLALVGEVSAP